MKKLVTLLFVVGFVQMSFGQLSGIYSIGTNTIGGEAGNYANLSAAIIAVNAAGISGPCTFYFTDNVTYVDTAVSLGCTGTSATNTITFKPYTGITCTLDFTSLIGKSIDGLWVIGSSNFSTATLVPTTYVIIDGSNTVSGTSKDLTIQNPSNTAQRSVFRIFGNNDNITIKNCIILNRSTSGSSTAPINVTNYNAASVNYTPDNLTIQNNTLTSTAANGSLGISLSNSGTPTVGITGLVVRENTISHRGTRGVMCNYVNDANIFGNTISSDNQQAGTAYAGIWLSTGTANAGTFNIYNNKFTQLRTMNTTDGVGFGIIGIDNQLSTNKIVNIYNNFIAGFTTLASTSNAKIYGIRHTGASTSNVYYNSIYFPEMVDMTTFGTSKIAGIAFATHATTEATPTGTMNLKNNIIISDETSMKTWGIRRVGTGGTFTSDYNDIYYNSGNSLGYVGYDNATDQQTLANWIANTAYDDNSKNVSVTFSSATNLQLAGGSIGDNNLTGTVLSSYTTDIDGDTRDALFPYMGADENTTTPLHSLTPRTVPMTSGVSNATSFGTRGVLGTDGSSTFYTHWDDTYLYLGWTGGRTNYSSDMYYAAIDIDPTTTNGTDNAIENVGFLAGDPKPDFYVVYENNSTFYGSPATDGSSYEIWNGTSGSWVWVSRTAGDDGISSQVDFLDAAGEVRLRIPWATLGFTPATGTKLGVVMWNNNASGDYMWGRVPTSNPANGSTPITLTMDFVYNNTGSGINPSSDKIEAALPIELTSFVSNVKGAAVSLTWKTATEVNSYGFEIQKSEVRNQNGGWEKVGFVQASGNSNSPREYTFTDNNLQEGKYQYRLKMIDNDGTFEYSNIIEAEIIAPKEFVLSQNYPNPFNPVTTINYAIPMDSKVMLVVYSINGEKVAELVNEMQAAGSYNIPFSATGLASGTYLYRLQAGAFVQTKKMILLK